MTYSAARALLLQNAPGSNVGTHEMNPTAGETWPFRDLRHKPSKVGSKGNEMKNLHRSGLAEIRALLEAPRSMDIFHLALEGSRSTNVTRYGGRRVIEPAICTIDGDIYWCRSGLSQAGLMVLHNEHPDAANYPLSFTSGLFFTEALSPENEHVNEYHCLVSGSLSIVRDALDEQGRLAFESIDEVGHRIQKLDAEFAQKKINQPQDELHRCYGPNPEHPYSKVALCRTTLPVVVEDRVIPFLFEKFLISYSYFDENGKRKSTVTPIHSHPLNFETVYFTSYGPKSMATEQEFHLILGNDQPLIKADGRIDPTFILEANTGRLGSITLSPGRIYRINAGAEPVMLPAFEADRFLKKASLINFTDGLFRPHRVTIHDDLDSDRETLYYAIDNYLGPRGRVLFFSGDGRINLWSHSNWR